MIRTEKIVADERMRPKLDKDSTTERVQLIAPRSWLDLVEEWRAGQRPVPNMSAAIRRLVEIGLAAEGKRNGR